MLKDQDAFAVFDPHGDIVPGSGPAVRLYHAGTRFLSGFELLLAGRQPLLLSSTISEDNIVFSADLTNPDVIRDARVVLARGALHLFRSRVLRTATLVERLRVTNHGLGRLEVPLTIQFDADFADIFEVRGTRRPPAATRLPRRVTAGETVLRYRGLDGVERRTRVQSSRARRTGSANGSLFFRVALEPHACAEIEITSPARSARAQRLQPCATATRSRRGGTKRSPAQADGDQLELRLQPVDAALAAPICG